MAMATKPQTNRSQQQAADDKLAAGLTKHQATLSSFVIGGKTVQVSEVLTALQSRKNTDAAATSAGAAWHAAVAADRDQRAASQQLVAGIKQSLHAMFGSSIDTLADFGLTPRKVPVVSPEVKVAAAAKAKATRAARHTQGPKQKAATKGVLDGVTLTVTAQPAPSASPAVPATPPAVAAGSVAATPAVSSR
jgi:hypothetical protein